MPFITEEIYSILFKKFKNVKSIHLESWPLPYKKFSTESAETGSFLIEIIKALRNLKSKLQLPLNKEISRVIISSKKENLKILTNFAGDIQNTIRINKLDVIDEKSLNESKVVPDLEEYIENLNVRLYLFK